jgi:hypothetical protein
VFPAVHCLLRLEHEALRSLIPDFGFDRKHHPPQFANFIIIACRIYAKRINSTSETTAKMIPITSK